MKGSSLSDIEESLESNFDDCALSSVISGNQRVKEKIQKKTTINSLVDEQSTLKGAEKV